MKTLAQLVRDARGIRTQQEFAEHVGCTRQSIYLWEKGKAIPSLKQTVKMGILVQYRRKA